MARTIVDRIKGEQHARKAAQEAILGAKRDPQEAGPPARAEGSGFFSSFAREVIPVIGQAVTSEISSSLDRVRQELVSCLEQVLSRTAPGPALERVSYEPAEELDTTDTDLDMPTEDVVKEIDRVLSEFQPAEKPVLRRGAAPTGPAAGRTLGPEAGEREEAAATAVPAETEQPAEPPVAETESLPPAHAAQPAAARREPFPAAPAAEVGRRESSPPRPAAPAAHARGPGPVEGGAAPSIAAAIHADLREVLVPGIAEGISGFAEDVTLGQERILREILLLGEQVAALEAELRSGVLPPDRKQVSQVERVGASGAGAPVSPQEFQATTLEILRVMEERIARQLASISSLLVEDHS